MSPDEAESVAIAAFTALTADEERMSRFMAVSGLRPDTIRQAVESPRFFAGILDYVVSDEPLLIALASEMQVRPGVGPEKPLPHCANEL